MRVDPGVRRLLDNILSLYLLQGLNDLIPLVTLPYLLECWGLRLRGAIAFVQSFVQCFNILPDCGFNFSATHKIAQNREDPSESFAILCRVYTIKFFFCVITRRLASVGKTVLIIDKREHVGGNAYDELDANGVLGHRYGPHIFHTTS